MKIPLLPEQPIFPNPRLADAEGLVGLSQDISPERLLAAYRSGIFPWFEEQGFFFWFCPDPRMMLWADELKIQKSMRPYLNQNKFTVSFDCEFETVIKACAAAERKGQESTWIANSFIGAYTELHEKGFAHSVEVWQDKILVGGLYGISLGGCFFGESMFSNVPNASKFGFIKLVHWLKNHGIDFIDCQVYTEHLASLGAKEMVREEFLEELEVRLQQQTISGKWGYLEG